MAALELRLARYALDMPLQGNIGILDSLLAQIAVLLLEVGGQMLHTELLL